MGFVFLFASLLYAGKTNGLFFFCLMYFVSLKWSKGPMHAITHSGACQSDD